MKDTARAGGTLAGTLPRHRRSSIIARYAALLRGINVGLSRRLAMSDLRSVLAELGYTDIATYLQSGNAVFTSRRRRPADLEREIGDGIQKNADLTVPCLVRRRDEMQSVVEGHPFPANATDGSRMMVLFLSAEPDPERLAAHDPVGLAPDDVHVGVREIYQWCPDGFHKAPAVGPFVEKHLGVTVTARNWNTVARLATLLDG